MRRWLLLAFLTIIAIDFPRLPLNIRAADVAFIAAAVSILAATRGWPRPRPHFLDIAVAVYLGGSFAALLFSPAPATGAVEMIRHLYLAGIYVIIAIALRQGFAATVATGLALSGGVLAAVGLCALAARIISGIGITELTPMTTLPYIGATVRLSGLTASASMFACVLAVSLPFAMMHPAIRASRARLAAVAAIFAAAAALTFSHSIAGIAVAALIVAWPQLRFAPVRIAAAAATVLVVLAFNFAALVAIRSVGTTPLRDDSVFQYGVDRGRTEIAGVNVEYQTMSYLRIKQVAWDAFVSRPLTGIGLDRFHSVTEMAYQEGRLTTSYRAIDPHSTFFGRFAEAGVIGGLTLIVLWLAIGRASLTKWLMPREFDWIAIAAAAGIAGTLVNSMNADVMNFRFLWVALGLVRGLSAASPTPSS
jgi:O-antigen ligase